MTGLYAAKYRDCLPQLGGRPFLTDGGMETTLIFHDGWELPMFASFVLMESAKGREALAAYYRRHMALALERGLGFVLESPTWRANPDWGAKLDYDRSRLGEINRSAMALMSELRVRNEVAQMPIVVSGNVGPRGDGYDPGKIMSAAQAEDYHGWQVAILAEAGADLVSAFTLTNVNEAVGFARAAEGCNLPCVVSFTVETDGRLPTGERLAEAIESVDEATRHGPAYYMINCAHPTHFDHVLDEHAAWTKRIKGLRANSSRCSHAELDNAPELDIGNPEELGAEYRALLARFPHITVVGGCCGTDDRHIACIGEACKVAA